MSDGFDLSIWRQGDLVAREKVEELNKASVDRRLDESPEMRLIVLSQDCDIVRDPKDEPFIELIAAQPILQKKHSTWQNPRLLHISYAGLLLEVNIHDRFRVKKIALAGHQPDEKMIPSQDERGILRQWVASRYIRPAFPDEFNRRIQPQKKRLEKLLTTETGRAISRIYISGANDEIMSEETYTIKIIPTYPETLPDMVSKLEEDLDNLFADCHKVVVEDIHSLSENDVTLSILRKFKWLHDYEFLSLPGKPGMARSSEQANIS
jgi:hypothetical protein